MIYESPKNEQSGGQNKKNIVYSDFESTVNLMYEKFFISIGSIRKYPVLPRIFRIEIENLFKTLTVNREFFTDSHV